MATLCVVCSALVITAPPPLPISDTWFTPISSTSTLYSRGFTKYSPGCSTSLRTPFSPFPAKAFFGVWLPDSEVTTPS